MRLLFIIATVVLATTTANAQYPSKIEKWECEATIFWNRREEPRSYTVSVYKHATKDYEVTLRGELSFDRGYNIKFNWEPHGVDLNGKPCKEVPYNSPRFNQED